LQQEKHHHSFEYAVYSEQTTMTTDGNPKIRPRITTVLLVAQELSLDGCPAFHGAESAQ